MSAMTESRTVWEDNAERRAEEKRQHDCNRGFHACLDFPWWKRAYARAFLQSPEGRTVFYRSVRRAIRDASEQGGEIAVWSSHADEKLREACAKRNLPLARLEDGFLRSAGLGSEFCLPSSLAVDRTGIYYDPSAPSDLENILNALPARPDHGTLVRRAAALRELILSGGLTKYNTGSLRPPPDFPAGRRLVLVPGQVEDDASVRCGGFGLGNLELLRAARAARPDAFLIWKPHPDVERGRRRGALPEKVLRRYADCVLPDFPMGRLLPLVHEVHTLTSQTGFEALLRGLHVVTYGGPFYAGWGLTEDRQIFPRRRARLTLDELTAGALLLYPSYYDWREKRFCRAEDVCRLLLEEAAAGKNHSGRLARILPRFWRNERSAE